MKTLFYLLFFFVTLGGNLSGIAQEEIPLPQQEVKQPKIKQGETNNSEGQYKPNPEIKAIQEGDIEFKSKTLGILDVAFKNHLSDYLDKISTAAFMTTPWYKQLRDYASHKNINLNYSSEIASQEFIIDKNNEYSLVVEFEKPREAIQWYIIDAYELKKGKKVPFGRAGFGILQFQANFSELLMRIKESKLSDYYGLAPQGKLNKKFTKDYELQLSREKTTTIKNIIIYSNNKIDEIIFLTLRYFPIGNIEGDIYKSGWLVTGGGPMKDFYTPGSDIFIDFLANRINYAEIKLDSPNEGISSVNLLTKRDNPDSKNNQKKYGVEVRCDYQPERVVIHLSFIPKDNISIETILKEKSVKKVVLNLVVSKLQGEKECHDIKIEDQPFNKELKIDFSKLDVDGYKIYSNRIEILLRKTTN